MVRPLACAGIPALLCLFVTVAVTAPAVEPDDYAVRVEVRAEGVSPVLWHKNNFPDLAACEAFLVGPEFQIDFLQLAMAVTEADPDADLVSGPSCELRSRGT